MHPWMIPTAGSDSHRPEDIGRTGIMAGESIDTEERLVEVLKSREYALILAVYMQFRLGRLTALLWRLIPATAEGMC